MDNKTGKEKELTDEEIQLSILTLLFKKRKTQPKDPELTREQIIEVLGIPEDKVNFNAGILQEQRLIDYVDTTVEGFVWAKITASGIEAITNKEEKKKAHHFLGARIPVHIEIKIGLINF